MRAIEVEDPPHDVALIHTDEPILMFRAGLLPPETLDRLDRLLVTITPVAMMRSAEDVGAVAGVASPSSG